MSKLFVNTRSATLADFHLLVSSLSTLSRDESSSDLHSGFLSCEPPITMDPLRPPLDDVRKRSLELVRRPENDGQGQQRPQAIDVCVIGSGDNIAMAGSDRTLELIYRLQA